MGNRRVELRVATVMKAIRIDHNGGSDQLRLEDVAEPQPGPGELRVRQTAIGVNFIDVYVRTGLYKRDLPLTLGQEGAGVVDAVGDGVTDFKPGMRVAYPGTVVGAYAEHTIVATSKAVPVPDDIDDNTACALMVQGLTAHYLTHSTYPIAGGDTIFVHAAAGGVGLLLTQLAKSRGATVIATVGSDEKAALAKGAGVDHCINYRTSDFYEETLRITGGVKLPVVYDSVGRDTYEKSIKLLRPRGLFCLYGASSGAVPPLDPQMLSQAGSLFFTRPTLVHYMLDHAELVGRANDLFAHVRAGNLDVRIGHVYPLADAARAHDDLEGRRTTGKVILQP